MAIPPKRIRTRQLAILAELGEDPAIVYADSFEPEGYSIIGCFSDRGTVTVGSDDRHGTTLVPWPNEDVARRAINAREDDYLETTGKIGPGEDVWERFKAWEAANH